MCCAVLSCLVAPILCNAMDCSPPGSSVHGDSPGKNTEWVAMPSSRGSSQPRDWTQVSRIAGRFLIVWATRKPMNTGMGSLFFLQGIFPNPGIKPGSPALQADPLSAELQGKPRNLIGNLKVNLFKNELIICSMPWICSPSNVPYTLGNGISKLPELKVNTWEFP